MASVSGVDNMAGARADDHVADPSSGVSNSTTVKKKKWPHGGSSQSVA